VTEEEQLKRKREIKEEKKGSNRKRSYRGRTEGIEDEQRCSRRRNGGVED
jgi:hypothetical protein